MNEQPLPHELPLSFEDHKEQTAKDVEQMADFVRAVAVEIRKGDMKAFERFWMEGGTEEGDAKISGLREILVLRYLHREERTAHAKPPPVLTET